MFFFLWVIEVKDIFLCRHPKSCFFIFVGKTSRVSHPCSRGNTGQLIHGGCASVMFVETVA